MELNNIRMSIEHYRIINAKLPEDLRALYSQKFTVSAAHGIFREDNYLKPFRLDKDNNLLDPFLNRYYYNSSNGIVKAQTKGYESW
jgi:hypothetical protein